VPKLSRLIIKTALVYLVTALLLGVFVTTPAIRVWPVMAVVVPSQVHLLVVGWLTQLIFGVAIWLFPRFSREQPHGVIGWAWAGYVFLNVGLILRLVGEPLVTQGVSTGLMWTLVASAVLQWAGCCLFVLNLWPRVRIK
jgi:hypothetical protein